MSEQEPSLRLNLDRIGSLEMTRQNSGLFTFLGKTAFNGTVYDNPTLDHVYVALPKEHEMRGVYLFKSMSPKYKQIATFMMRNHFQLSLNHQTVPDSDLLNYEAILERQQERYKDEIPDFLPDDFK